MIYATIQTLHQIKYLQPFAMNILLFIFSSLSFYFMSLTMMFSLIKNFNEHLFKKEKRNIKEQNNKRHMSLKFLLDKRQKCITGRLTFTFFNFSPLTFSFVNSIL